MSEKRKLTTRATAASKKRKSESTPPESVQKTATSKSATPVVEDGLPRTHTAGKPLPTVTDPQPEDLSSKEFQSVAERYIIRIAQSNEGH